MKNITVYEFNELNDEVKEQVIEKFRTINVDYDGWYDGVFSYAKEVGELMGITIEKIYFTGFWSQGDGACFEGTYRHKKDSVRNVKKFTTNKTLQQIAITLQTVQKRNQYKAEAYVKHRGHYYHSGCTDIFVYRTDDKDVIDEDIIKQALRDFMDWIYSTLEKEYFFLISDEQVIETIRINGFMFTKDGIAV